MADITHVHVTAEGQTYLESGTGTYDPDGLVVTAIGQWNIKPSGDDDIVYTIDFKSNPSYQQPFNDCACTNFDKPAGTFSVQG